MRRHLAVIACLAFTGSIAQAAPGKRSKRKAKVAPPVADEIQMDGDDVGDDDAEPRCETWRCARDRAREAEARDDKNTRDRDRDGDGGDRRRDRRHDRDRDQVAYRDQGWGDRDGESVFLDDDADAIDADNPLVEARAEPVDRPEREPRSSRRARTKPWSVAVGPYLWASAVDANVSLGPASVSTGVDFMDITRHARYGAELLAQFRYGRYAVYGDLMYGVVALDGAKEVGPLMVSLDGTASSLLIETTGGYTLVGADPQALVSVEARAGVRYQRTAISGAVNVSGADVSNPNYIDAAADALAGGQVVVRPFRRFFVSGTADLGVYGDSTSTWSASADAGYQVTKRLLLSLGWRTLTTERPNVSITMHGPRAAFQLTF